MLFWQTKESLVKCNLLFYNLETETLCYFNFFIACYLSQKEQECILQHFTIHCLVSIIWQLFRGNLSIYLLFKYTNNICVGVTMLQMRIWFLVCSDELVLVYYKVSRFRVVKYFTQYSKKRLRIKFHKPSHKPFICHKSNYVHNIVAPSERAKIALREFFALQKQCNNPKNLITNISAAMLNLNLIISLLFKFFSFIFFIFLLCHPGCIRLC